MSAAPGDTVLVVDDDAVLRDSLRDALAGEGFRVGCVDNGRQAIDVLRAGARPSVILLDLHTPEMDGLEFRRLQRSDPAIADIPVIVLTGDLERESEALRLGVAFYMTKPMPFPQLVDVVAHFAAPRPPAEAEAARNTEG